MNKQRELVVALAQERDLYKRGGDRQEVVATIGRLIDEIAAAGAVDGLGYIRLPDRRCIRLDVGPEFDEGGNPDWDTLPLRGAVYVNGPDGREVYQIAVESWGDAGYFPSRVG